MPLDSKTTKLNCNIEIVQLKTLIHLGHNAIMIFDKDDPCSVLPMFINESPLNIQCVTLSNIKNIIIITLGEK